MNMNKKRIFIIIIVLLIIISLTVAGVYFFTYRENDFFYYEYGKKYLKRENIKNITIIDTLKDEKPQDFIKSWKYTEFESDNPIKAWLVKNEEDGIYDLYLGAENGIKLNERKI